MNILFSVIFLSNLHFLHAIDISEYLTSVAPDYNLHKIANPQIMEIARNNTFILNNILDTISDNETVQINDKRYPFLGGIKTSHKVNLTLDIADH